ncbi:YfhO family protein [Streptomyces sp. NBC_00385]|uniref:YfhO family protein n=1 Tax=Streptomyces sp. NBC_00385 TaxID=2975733 RepID=UPI002DD91378|nr:YfhO family protein [Streptomyces sp. NBC_00385]WRZ04337.1 YfhO family protein [Streptomyces sp. NBC_00385]
MRTPSIIRSPRGRGAALAALLTVATVCAGDAVARSYPFGPHTRSVNDLGNQFVPFHTRLWDLLHGRADGGLLLNWQSGFGSSFLPDFGTYLSSPFALLVGVFPRDRIDLAVYAVTLVKTGVAAAAMTWLLTALRRGRGREWAAAVLGASYALCGWSVVEAAYNPMWLDGLIAFPLLCLAGEWARTGRRPVLGTLLVTLAWVSNFYTAYMATLGAALVLVARLLLEDGTSRERIRGLVRAARTVLIGIGLAAPVLVPVFLGTRHAYPGWNRTFAPAAWPDVAARLLPATYSFFSPALFLGTGALLLACALAFHRAVPRTERFVWAGLVAAVALSLQWGPTHLLWHAFATPNGSPFRQTFVLSGLVVIAAWFSVATAWPDRRTLLGGAGVLVLIAAGAASSTLITGWTYPLFAAGLLAVTGALVLARSGRFAVLAALLLIGAQAGQAAATTAYADRQRLNRLDDYAPWGERQTLQAAAVAGADGWPRYRTDPGLEQSTANDPLLVGGQGGAYYSSHTPDVLTRTFLALGAGWTSNGRALHSLDNPVTDAVFSVGARVRMPRDPHQGFNRPDGRPVTVTRQDAPPLVTLRPAADAVARLGRSPFRNQERLLGAAVYTVPATTLRAADGTAATDEGAYDYRVRPGAYSLTANCPANSEVYLWAPDLFGRAQLGTSGEQADFRGELPGRRAGMRMLGTGGGQLAVPLRVARAGTVPHEALGCLDRGRLDAAVAGLKRTGATRVDVTGSGVRAELQPGTNGLAVLAAPRIAGWSCDGHPADSYLGLVATPVNGDRTTVDCTFRPPGLRAGSLAGAGALAALLATVLIPRARMRGRAVRLPR